jgi:hypothetical protein
MVGKMVLEKCNSCEHGSEPSGSIKCREFLDYLSNYQLLKEYSASWS